MDARGWRKGRQDRHDDQFWIYPHREWSGGERGNNADPYAHVDADSYADPYADPYAHVDADADSDPYAHVDADSYACLHGDSGSQNPTDNDHAV